MKLAIVGSRTFNDYDLFVKKLMYYVAIETIDLIISGGAIGTDSLAKEFTVHFNMPYLEFPAEWDKYGKSAGYRRNIDIVRACDEVLAFWDGKSKGTKHTIDIAKQQNKKVTIINI